MTLSGSKIRGPVCDLCHAGKSSYRDRTSFERTWLFVANVERCDLPVTVQNLRSLVEQVGDLTGVSAMAQRLQLQGITSVG